MIGFKRINLKTMKLATKTSLIIAVVLTISFSVLISSVALSVSREMKKTIDGEFSGIATQNGLIVQGIIDDAASSAQDLQDYLQTAYAEYNKMLETQAVDADGNKVPFPTEKSVIYDVDLIALNHEIENYILNTAWSTVRNNPDIEGIGAFFEPYAYDPSIKDYTIYVGVEDANKKTAQSYGAYSEYSKNEYYAQAASTQKNIFTKPYTDQGVTMVTAAFPIVSGSTTQGVIVVDINVGNFSKVKSTDEKYPTMYTNIFAEDGTIVYDSESTEFVGQKLADLLGEKVYTKISEKTQAGETFSIETPKSDGSKVVRYYYPIKAGENTWWSATALKKGDLNKSVTQLSLLMIAMAVLGLAVIVCVTVWLLKRLLKPINTVVDAAKEIEHGNLDVKIEVETGDEIGQLAMSFKSMARNLKEIIGDVSRLLSEMGSGNFKVKTGCEDKYIGAYKNILSAVRTINYSLSDTLTQINQASDQVSGGAEQVSVGAQVLSQGATEQASSVEELSATLAELSAQIKRTADNAQVANKLSMEAGEGVVESNQKMQEMIVAMSEISTKSNEIGKIIKTIDDIAFQTNILALNAAVEAARAGTAGKGFAVVADEVRNLAQKSAEAAKNTTVLIEDTVGAVGNGTAIADKTAQSLQSVVDKTSEVNDRIDQIAKASEEQAGGIMQVTQGVEQISAVVQTNSATAEESAAASEELSGQAQMLKDLVGKFKLKDEMEAHLPEIRALEPQIAGEAAQRFDENKY